MSGRRALVTGGAGFIGSNLALELERLGWRVTVLDNFSSGNYANLNRFHGDVMTADLETPGALRSVRPPPDAIFHLASVTDTTVTDPRRMMTNVEGFRRVLEYARKHGLPVVYASSAAVYGNGPLPMREDAEPAPPNLYGFSKRIMENLAAEFRRRGVRSVGLRYFNVYGPGEDHKGSAMSMVGRLARRMIAGQRPRIFKFGEQGRDFVHVEDVVAATIRALDYTELHLLNVGTGLETTFNEVIRFLNDALGTNLEPEYFDNPYAGAYQNHTRADVSRLTEGTGFRLKYTPREGIAAYARSLRGR